MGEQQCAGNGDEDGKDKPGTAGGDAACWHAPFEYRKSDYQQCEKTMQQDFRIRQRRPEADRAEGPSLRIAAEKQKCRQAEERKWPMARPGDLSCLRDEGQESHRQNDEARPVMVVLGPSLFRGSIRACSSLTGDVGFGGERARFECSFLRSINVFWQLLNGRAGEPWGARRHAREDFRARDAVASEIRGGRK